MVDLKGRLVFVTGAGSGIGRALAREFLKEGAKVVAIDLDQKALDEFKEEAALLGFSLDVLRADVGDKSLFLAALDSFCEKNGPPFVFVNNAGIAKVGGFVETGLESFDKVLRVNLGGVVTGTHFALSRMEKAGGGAVVNIASLAGHLPAAFMASYSASKFAVVGFTRALQAELEMAHSPVKVCLVSPGFIDTPIMNQESASFPWFLRWLVDKPGPAAREIVRGVKAGKKEIYPDAGGRLMKRLYRLAPGFTVKGSRALLAKSMGEFIGKEPIRLK